MELRLIQDDIEAENEELKAGALQRLQRNQHRTVSNCFCPPHGGDSGAGASFGRAAEAGPALYSSGSQKEGSQDGSSCGRLDWSLACAAFPSFA